MTYHSMLQLSTSVSVLQIVISVEISVEVIVVEITGGMPSENFISFTVLIVYFKDQVKLDVVSFVFLMTVLCGLLVSLALVLSMM